MADSTPSPKSSTEAPEVPPTDELSQDGVPDILEIFGAAPLVGADEALEVEPALELDEDIERVAEAEHDDAAPSDAAPSAEHALDAGDDADADDANADANDAGHALGEPVDAPTAPRDTAPADAPRPATLDTELLDELRTQMGGTLMLLEQRMGSLEETLDGVAKQNSFLPPKLRGLGKKVDELSSSIGDGRLRELFGELVSLVDLLDAGLADTQDVAAQRTLSAVSTRLKQCFESRGLVGVETDGPFDPTRHQAAERRAIGDPAQDGMVVEVFRRGWRDAHSVLRYADVAVGAFDPTLAEPSADADAPELAATTLTPGNVRAPAAPRKNQPTDSPDENEGDTDRTAAKASSRNTKTDDKDDA